MKVRQGFTLIELMIVVAIIGLLAMIAIPNFSRYIQKAKRAEAYMNLNAIYAAQKAYQAEHGNYGSSLAQIGFALEGNKKQQYDYAITESSKDAFKARALAQVANGPEILEVDQNNSITVVQEAS